MRKVHAAAWAGIAMNALVLIVMVCTRDRYDLMTQTFILLLMGVGLFLSLAGAIMLVFNEPAGNIIGMIGSIFFMPVGLIALIGFRASKENMVVQRLREVTPNAHAAARRPGDEILVLTPAMRAEEPTRQEAPYAAFTFTDWRWMWNIAIGLGVLGLVIAVSSVSGPSIGWRSGNVFIYLVLFIIAGCIGLGLSTLRHTRNVFALYSEHMEVALGDWIIHTAHIPYANIQSAVHLWNKVTLTILDAKDQSVTVKIQIQAIPSARSAEAHEALKRKFRELGV